MIDRELPSIDELLAGRMRDGSSPPLHSGKLYEHWKKPLPGINEQKTASDLTAEELHYLVDKLHLDDLDLALNFTRDCLLRAMDLTRQPNSPGCKAGGSEAGQNEPTTPDQENHPTRSGEEEAEAREETADAEGVDASSGRPGAAPDVQRVPELRGVTGIQGLPEDPLRSRTRPKRFAGPARGTGATEIPPPPQKLDDEKVRQAIELGKRHEEAMLAVRGDNRKPSTRQTREIAFADLNAAQVMTLAERAAKLMPVLSEQRAAVAHKLIDDSKAVDMKTSFMWDRAHAVVAATLLHMDESFDKLGFGAWMPFRFPDQWLMFCSVMQRVLAANGLIHSSHPEIYRRLLEETPPVDWPEGILDTGERIEKLKTPENWSRCWSNRGARTLTELKERLEKEVWNKSPP
ncbi:MAG: hypothetical protein R3E76_13395 [Planctomycetota bacterium]